LVGAAIVGFSLGLAVVSFCATAPISIYGAALGASMMIGAIAITTGSAGLTASIGAGIWAGKACQKKSLQNEMELLADKASRCLG
jgi:hypothetical protein